MALIGYARVSTKEDRQVLDRQLDALKGAKCDRVFEDRISGAATERAQSHHNCQNGHFVEQLQNRRAGSF